MKITLYKQCILSNSYSEVFDNKTEYSVNGVSKTALEHYLSNLESFTTEQDSVYMTNSGTLYFELVNGNEWESIYEFNYMKITQGNFVRYCFINNIEIGNGIASISYDEDIWHSYTKDITLRNSYLSNARIMKYNNYTIPFRELPIDYQSNDKITYNSIINNIDEDLKEYYAIIVQTQMYDLAQGGKQSQRYTTVSILIKTSDTVTDKTRFEFDEAIRACSNIMQQQATSFKGDIGNGEKEWYFEFGNLTIVPYAYIKGQNGQPVFEFAKNDIFHSDFAGSNDTTQQIVLGTIKNTNEIITTRTGTIRADFKTVGIGTFSSDYGCANNGTNYHYEIGILISRIDFKILFNYFGKMIDITSDFVIDIPFNSINGETQAQRQIARENATINGSLQIVGGMTQIATDLVTMGMGAENAGKQGMRTYRYNKLGKVSSIKYTPAPKQVDPVSEIGGIIGGASQIVNGITGIVQANKKQFQTTYGAFILGNKELNCKYGLIIKKITPDNQNEVDEMIFEIGYNVFEIVDEKIFYPVEFNERQYNSLKFEYVNCYGKAPQAVINAYKKILIDGIKIWYSHNV